jgi:hypothetical protein
VSSYVGVRLTAVGRRRNETKTPEVWPCARASGCGWGDEAES